MARMEFTLENVRKWDFGKVEAIFRAHLQRAVKDCLERPGDETKRHVVLNFSLAPVLLDPNARNRDCDAVNVETEVYSTVPKHRTQVYTMQPTNTGGLAFNPDLPGQPAGKTLFDEQEKKADSAGS